MKAAVFDTNILIDYTKGFPQAKKLFDKYDYKVISIITFIELLSGAKSDDETEILKLFIYKNFEVLDLDVVIANETVKLRAESITKKHKLKLPDCIILATSITQAIPLITRNHKDFEEYDNIIVPYSLGTRGLGVREA